MKTNPAIDYVLSKGYKNIAQFADACGIHRSNVMKNLRGTEKPNIKRLFIYASTLKCDMDTILRLLYTEDMKTLDKVLNEKNKAK